MNSNSGMCVTRLVFVIPAQAGMQCPVSELDPGFRRDDDAGVCVV
jgi:hypothetical protein